MITKIINIICCVVLIALSITNLCDLVCVVKREKGKKKKSGGESMTLLIILLICSIFTNIVFGYGFVHFYNEWCIDEKIIKKASEVLEEVNE